MEPDFQSYKRLSKTLTELLCASNRSGGLRWPDVVPYWLSLSVLDAGGITDISLLVTGSIMMCGMDPVMYE
jgi:hypothetical protein